MDPNQPQYPTNPNIPPRVDPGYPQYPSQPQYPYQQPHGTYAPPAQMLPPKKKIPTWAWIVGGVATVLILCCCMGTMISALGNGGTNATLSPTNTPRPTSTPVPTATTDPNAAWHAYRDLVQTHSTLIASDSTDVSTACQSGSLSRCRAALQTFDDDVLDFISDLDKHPAPACLKAADTNLRTGLALYDKGAKEAIKGIDQLDTSLINKGSTDISTGTTWITKATSAVKAAHCP